MTAGNRRRERRMIRSSIVDWPSHRNAAGVADREQRQDDQAGAGQHLPDFDRSRVMNCAAARRLGIARDDRSPPSAGATAAICAARASRFASLRSRRFEGARSVIEKRHKVKPRNSRPRTTRRAVEQHAPG